MVDLVSIASFVLPFVLDSIFGEGVTLKGIRLPRPKTGPTLWHRMIRFAARIYKQLNHAQKQKLFDFGALPPDFEPRLVQIFQAYLGEKPPSTPDLSAVQHLVVELIPEQYDYSKFDEMLKKIKPSDMSPFVNQFTQFKSKVAEMKGEIKIYSSRDKHPNYPDLYAHWKNLHTLK